MSHLIVQPRHGFDSPGSSVRLLLVVLLSACIHEIEPVLSVAPPPIQPLNASVILILTDRLDAYESAQTHGFHSYFFHFG